MIKISNGVLSATFTQIGASLRGLWLKDVAHSLVLGFGDQAEYERNPAYVGTAIGRVANRIGGAKFDIGDGPVRVAANEGANQLHGGPMGWSRRPWQPIEQTATRVQFTLTSAHGDQGFPGTIVAKLAYELVGAALVVDFQATTDRPTPLAFTTHNYFNLTGKPGLEDHGLWLNADAYCALDAQGIPTGDIVPCTTDFPPLTRPLDLNFIVSNSKDGQVRHQATLSASNGVQMDIYSNEPGIQVYNAHGMNADHGPGLAAYAGVALEPQLWPDALNHPHFPNAVLRPAEVYHHLTRFDFGQSLQV